MTDGLPPVAATLTKVEWLLSEPLISAKDIQDDFTRYSLALGKRTCHPRTLRRQHELLLAYGRTNNYPSWSRAQREQRPAWVREHLRAMVVEVQRVPCWHPQHDLSNQDRDKVLSDVVVRTSLARLSALVLAQLHSTTVDYLLIRLLPRRRR